MAEELKFHLPLPGTTSLSPAANLLSHAPSIECIVIKYSVGGCHKDDVLCFLW